MDLAALAHQVTDILVPALPLVYASAVDKGKEMLLEGCEAVVDKSKDMLLEKGIEKLGSNGWRKSSSLLQKISPKMSASLEKALIKVSEHSENPDAKEELQLEILKLLIEDPNLARDIELTINFNVENVDQLAVGNYNNFLNFETSSGEELIKAIEYLDQRRKEAANQEILSCYNPSALPYYPEKLKKLVTENRADELRKTLTYIENHRILLISGVGGVGKSTLARALIELRPINVPEPFWFSFYDYQDAKLGDILERLAAYMKAPEIASFRAEKREPGKSDVDRLIRELYRRSDVWLIFDDLSMMLEDQHFDEKEIEFLFSSFRSKTHNAKVVITSRVLPTLENGESLIDVDDDEEKHHLIGLKTNFAVAYLASNGLEEVGHQNLEKLATGVDGHPLALKLLVKLVKKHGAANILSDLSIYQTEKENTIKKARNLFNKLAGDEKELLERISVYREPVKWEGLKNMFTENTPKNAIDKLIDKSLLETDNNGNYWLHSLIQEFSYEDLKNKKEAHHNAYDYYKSLNLLENPTRKEELQPAIEAHYHACEAGEYDLAAEILLVLNVHALLDLWGNPRTLIEIFEKLLPKDHSKGEPILKDKWAHGAVLKSLGLAYYQLGEAKKAIDYYEQALIISREIGDRRREGHRLGNLGNAYRDLGDAKKAIDYCEEALTIAREIGDRRGEGTALGNLGNTYNDLGDAKRAINYYEHALTIAREVGYRRGEGNHLGNMGNAYHQLGDAKKAIDYYEQALSIAREIGDRRGEGNRLGNLGNTYSAHGDVKKAIVFLKESLAIGKLIENSRLINFCEQKLKELEGFNE